jgi:HEAT repeat protein
MFAEMTSLQTIIRALDLTDAAARRRAESELMQIGRPALDALIEALPVASLRQQVVILKLIGRMANADSMPVLKNALLDPQWLIRQAAVNALANFPAEKVLPLIYHALYDHALLVRLEAILALGQLRHASAVPTLLAHLQSTTSETETYTLIEALGVCADRSIIPLLEPYVHHDHPQVRQRALEAISRLMNMTR